jgi:hypothetical protein
MNCANGFGKLILLESRPLRGHNCAKKSSRISGKYSQLALVTNNPVSLKSLSGFGEEAQTRLFYSKIGHLGAITEPKISKRGNQDSIHNL